MPVVAAVIERRGRFLLAQRPVGKHLAHHWEFPGGKVAAGETPAAALARELFEELGLAEVQVGAELARIADPTRAIELTFLRVAASKPPVPLEHQALGWYNVSESRRLRLAPLDHKFLRQRQDVLLRPSTTLQTASNQETPS